MVPVCVFIAGGFSLGAARGPCESPCFRSRSSKRKQEKKREGKTSGAHSGEKASANTKTLGDGPNALKPESNTERMTTKIETFRRASAFALHVLL